MIVQPEAERIVPKWRRIAAAANSRYKWEFTYQRSEMVNAFCTGGKVAAYTGIFAPARDEAVWRWYLATVAHALARHTAERMSQGLLCKWARRPRRCAG